MFLKKVRQFGDLTEVELLDDNGGPAPASLGLVPIGAQSIVNAAFVTITPGDTTTVSFAGTTNSDYFEVSEDNTQLTVKKRALLFVTMNMAAPTPTDATKPVSLFGQIHSTDATQNAGFYAAWLDASGVGLSLNNPPISVLEAGKTFGQDNAAVVANNCDPNSIFSIALIPLTT